MVDVISDPEQVWEPWALAPRHRTAKELAGMMGLEGPHGQFLLREFMKWIADKKPIDRYGYDQCPDPKYLEGWREYQVKQLAHSLDTIHKMYRMMDNSEEGKQYA